METDSIRRRIEKLALTGSLDALTAGSHSPFWCHLFVTYRRTPPSYESCTVYRCIPVLVTLFAVLLLLLSFEFCGVQLVCGRCWTRTLRAHTHTRNSAYFDAFGCIGSACPNWTKHPNSRELHLPVHMHARAPPLCSPPLCPKLNPMLGGFVV